MHGLGTLPDPDSLRCFLAAFRSQSFRAAAREVALTPAALGQRIRLLEERLGTRLFARTTRRVTPTEAALGLAPAAERALAASAECVHVARDQSARPRMDVVVGTRYELGRSWLVPELERLRRSLPQLRLHVYVGSGADLLLRVRTGEIDCAVTSARFSDPRLDAIALHEERYVLVASERLLRRRPLARAEDAAAHVLVDTAAELPLLRYFREARGAPDLRFGEVLRVGAIGPIKDEVLRGAGVAVLPLYFVARELRSRRLVRLFPRVTLLSDVFRLVYRVRDPRSRAFEALAAALLTVPLR